MSALKIIGGLVGVILALIGGGWLMNSILIPVTPYTDMLPVHSGCSAFLDGETPYSESATLRAQERVASYDPNYDPADDPHRFVYPVHHCVILLPLWITPYDMSAPVWMFLNFMLFAMSPIVFLTMVTGYRVPIGRTILLIMASLFLWRYSMITVIFAQYTGWILFCLLGAMWALKTERPIALALFLVGLTVRTGGAFFAIAILLYVLYERRYRVVIIFGAVMLALWGITLLVVGPWIADFLGGLLQYTSYREDVAGWLPFRLGVLAGIVYAVLMGVGGLGVFYRAWQAGRETLILWGLAMIALWILVYLPQTNNYTLVYVLPSLFLVAYAFRENVLLFLMGVILIIAPTWVWSLYLTEFFAPGLDQLIIPFVTMLTLLLALFVGEPRIASEETASPEAVPSP